MVRLLITVIGIHLITVIGIQEVLISRIVGIGITEAACRGGSL
jgi:hypothetical protein